MSGFSHALIPFIGGLIVGGLLVWWLLPVRRNLHRLEEEKEKVVQELTRYRGEVDAHFERTVEAVSAMTQVFRNVHEQLAEDARHLCSEESRRNVLAKTLPTLVTLEGQEEPPRVLHQPLDYAPQSQGTLAEDFGFKRKTGEPVASEPWRNPPRDYAEGCDDQGCSTVDGASPVGH